MNWKNRLTNYNFWISIISAVLLILQAFNIEFDIAYINEIATAVLGLLVVIGIISDPTKTVVKKETNEKIKKEEQKVEETLKVKTEEKVEESEVVEKVEECTIPNIEESKVDADNNENDYENVVNTISADLKSNENIKELTNILLNLFKNEKTEVETEASKQNYEMKEEVKVEEQQIEQVAEDNQTIDNKNEEISSFNIVN